jgi:hypothetical protein
MTIINKTTAIFTAIVMVASFTMPAQAETLEECLKREGNSRAAQTRCALNAG